PKDNEIAMARMLVESMAGDFEPEGHVDDYKEAVEALVQSKIEGGEVTEPPESEDEGESGEVVDLLAALQRSVERARAGRGESSEAEDQGSAADDEAEDAAGRTAKKAAPRKTTAKKTAAGKTAAKKAPTKKTTDKGSSPRKKAG